MILKKQYTFLSSKDESEKMGQNLTLRRPSHEKQKIQIDQPTYSRGVGSSADMLRA